MNALKLIGFLRLMRLANIVTAVSDILAGIAVAGYLSGPEWDPVPIALLTIATIGLYGGGVVFNDVFDAELDRLERPERPIPSGLISKRAAMVFGAALLLLGILAASLVHEPGPFSLSGLLAIGIALASLVYDKWSKHHSFLGPLNMGICRGLNLLLGMSIAPQVLEQYGWISIVPVIYVAAITMISRGEVHGGKQTTLYGAALLYAAVILSILLAAANRQALGIAAVFTALFALMIFPPLLKAIRHPAGPLIGKAVKAGVLALIIMNAAWASAFGFPYFALAILLLLPVSLLLAKLFAVT
ncbi:MAG TPA: UbiA-like protein EboC [Flavitalea sp.]|nr:UbiA-like protein EboC [Flavitalea sp.]